MADRLPAHVEVAGLIRLVETQGGFATVLARGERDGGVIALVVTARGEGAQLYERMPQLDGTRAWHRAKVQDAENPYEFTEYLDRRGQQDRDVWIIELDLAAGERLIGLTPPPG